jgi:hypothetical protein
MIYLIVLMKVLHGFSGIVPRLGHDVILQIFADSLFFYHANTQRVVKEHMNIPSLRS